jgi:hypothetical protein
MEKNIFDVSAVDNLANESSNPPDKKYDWFMGDLAGFNSSMPDMYTQGLAPEDYGIHEASKYWKDPEIRKPFEEKFGAEAEAKFNDVYGMSKKRLEAYGEIRNDLSGTSKHMFIAPGKIERNLSNLGYGAFDNSKPVEVNNAAVRRDPWGAEEIYRTSYHSVFTPPKHSIRQGAEINGVLDKNGELVGLDQYLETNPGTNLVYAKDEEGNPLLKNGLNYLRPLEYGEERKPWEEIYGAKLNTYFGMNGIERPDHYWLKFTGKNVMNFSADVVDSAAEMFKLVDNLWQDGDQSAWDKGLTEIQNDVNSALFVPTSEQGMQKWYSTEGIVDGLTQVAGQLMGMVGVARTASGLANLVKLGSGERVGSVAGRLWMATLSSDDFVKEARLNGFSPKEQAAMYSMYVLGMYKIAGLSDMAINPAKTKIIQANVIKNMLGEMAQTAKATGGKLTPSGMWQATKNGLNSLKTALASDSGAMGYLAAGTAEAAEEVSEVLFDKTFKQAVNSIYNPVMGNIYGDTRRDTRFNVNWEDLPTQIAQSATLGFAGGMLARRIINPKVMDTQTLLAYGAVEGGYDKLDKQLDKLYSNGQLIPGGKKIDVLGKEILDGNIDNSREHLVYKALKNEVAGARALWQSMGLKQAFKNTEEALKFVTDSSVMKQSSIGNDISSRLTEMVELEAKIAGGETNDEVIKKSQLRIDEVKKELEDIKAGRYAAKYLAEGIYNVHVNKLFIDAEGNGTIMPKFDRYDQLDKSLAARAQVIEKMKGVDGMTVEDILLQKPSISQEQYDKLNQKLKEKHGLTDEVLFEDQEPELVGSPESIDRYNKERAELDALRYPDPPLASSEFFRTANPDGNPGELFQNILENELKLSQDKTKVYDDVEGVDKIHNSIIERLAQIEGIIHVNRIFNITAEEGKLGVTRPDIDNVELVVAKLQLKNLLGKSKDLRDIAQENRKSFYQASLKAWAGQVQSMAGRISRIQDIIGNNPEFADLTQKLSPLTTAIANEEDADKRLSKIFEAEEIIHAQFVADKKGAIDRLWQLGDFDNEVSGDAKVYRSYATGDFVYLKSLINMNPKEFRDAYLTALSEAKDLKFTPFPEQYFASFVATASLMGGYNPLERKATTPGNDKVVNAVLTESIFINGHQGVGKTFIASLALRSAQIMKGGGKVAVIAKQNDLRKKNFIELGNLKVNREESIAQPLSANDLIGLLNEGKLKETNIIYIDEVTMYSRDELFRIDQAARAINSEVKEEQNKIKILLTGDTHQATVMDDANENSYSIDQNTMVDQTPHLGFSFRSGNQDIVGMLKHFSNLFNSLQQAVRPPVVSFNYNKETLAGTLITDEIDKAIADTMKRKEVATKDIVVISTPERLAEIRKKHEKILGDSQLLTPIQAQGLQWSHVIVDLPFTLSGQSTEKSKMQLRNIISAVGRAKNSVIINNQSALGIISGMGTSDYVESKFTDEQLTLLREKHDAIMSTSGVSKVSVQSNSINRPVVKVDKQEEVIIHSRELSNEMKEKMKAMILSVRPPAGKMLEAHSFATTRIEYNDNGPVNIVNDPAKLQIWKKQLFYPGMFQETDFDTDNVTFEIRLESTGVPTGLLNKPGVKPMTGKPNLIFYAILSKAGEPVGEMQVLSVQAWEDSPALPNMKITMSSEESKSFLDQLRLDLPRAERETTNQFKEENDKRFRGEKVEKKSVLTLGEFKARNPMWQYASEVWHAVNGSDSKAGKVPFLFYSPSLTVAEINEALRTKQVGKAVLEQEVSSQKEIMEASLKDLAAQNVFAIALDGGNIIPVDQFLHQVYEDKLKGKTILTDHRLDKSAKDRLLKFLAEKFEIDIDKAKKKDGTIFGESTLRKLEKLNTKSMKPAEKKYLLGKVIKFIRSTGSGEHELTAEVAGPNEIKYSSKGNSKSVTLQYNIMLEEIYRDFVNKSENSAHAESVIDWLKSDVWPQGVFKSTRTEQDSTKPRDTTFGEISKEDAASADYSVSNLLMPPMPVFMLDQEFVKNIVSKGDVQGYSVDIKVTYKPSEDKEGQAAISNAVVRVPIDSVKSDTGESTIDIAAGQTSASSTIWGFAKNWFPGHTDNMWLGQFFGVFKRGIVYNNLFNLNSDTPHIITQKELHSTIVKLKRELRDHAQNLEREFGPRDSIIALLRSGNETMRIRYYQYVVAHEFDFLLKTFFPGISAVQGQYRYTTRDYKQGPVPDSRDVSHLETGNDLVKLHLFSMPVLDNAMVARNFTKEDYYRFVRMVRDNDITSYEKAVAYFKVDRPQTPNDLLKRSFYLRFLNPVPTKINGTSYHSLISAATEPTTKEMASSHITGMLSFLSSGSESVYTRSVFDFDMTSTMSGRNIDIDPSRFRQNLEDGIRAIHELTHSKSITHNSVVRYFEKTEEKPETVAVTFPVNKKGTQNTTWYLSRDTNGVSAFRGLKGAKVDSKDLNGFLRAVGLGEVQHNFRDRLTGEKGTLSLRQSIFEIAKYLSQDNMSRPIFQGAALTDWIVASDMLSDIRQLEGTYGRLTLDGEYQELITTGYPYVRTNQKVKELSQAPGVLARNSAVKNEMAFTSFLIKDGFESKDGSRKRPNSKMTLREQLFYDFNELYLSSLSRHKITDIAQRAVFNPITFSDKGRDGVVQVEAAILPRRAGKVDIDLIKNRAVENVTNYYQDLSRGIINTWYRVLGSTTQVDQSTQPTVLKSEMLKINAIIQGLTPEKRRDLVGTDLVSELMYIPQRESIVDPDGKRREYYTVGSIKQEFIDNVDITTMRAKLESTYGKFRTDFNYISSNKTPESLLKSVRMTFDEARDSFFWNHVWVANTFNSLWVGPQEQYKSKQEYYDMIKRASQISTNRTRTIHRSESWQPGQDIFEGRKMGRFSNTAIIRDFTAVVAEVSGGNIKQKLFDGSSFFNIYGKLQMKYSYGNDAGFNVGSNLKPIGNYLNPANGSARYDKYASFEITPQMATTGHPFIRRINELMMKSITFPGDGVNEGIMVTDGNVVKNLFELDAWGKSQGLTEVEIYDYMVSKGLQDSFVREVTFDSSVKNGASNINDFGNDMNHPLLYDKNTLLKTLPRDNAEWGLILDASKESNDSDARLAGQFVSTFLQSVHTQEEAIDIMKAIQKIGDDFRESFDSSDRDAYMKVMRDVVSSRDGIGLMDQLVNMDSSKIPLSNRTFMKALHSSLSAWLSDNTIRLRIFGGQQVIAPASGVFRITEGITGPAISKPTDINARELKGFNAWRSLGDDMGRESILDTPVWQQLNSAVAAKNTALANELRKQLRQELKSGKWEVEAPEIIVSPTHFRAFGIPDGTNLENINEELFLTIDTDKEHERFNRNMKDDEGNFIVSEADRLAHQTAVEGNAATKEQIRAIQQPYVDAIIKARENDEKYIKQMADFSKTLNIIMGRIPATFFQSLTPLKVVGFAHGSDNTAYVHPDILILQGADHDIDKGNIMAFEPDSKGRIIIPESLEEAGDNAIYLKNFILKRMLDGLAKPEVLVESTLPTNTENIDTTIQKRGLTVDKSENAFSPISNNRSYVRGQSGRQNVGIHASGLKTYSSVFHSAIQRGRTYSNYVPKSQALSRGGNPFVLSGIDGGVEGLIMFGEAIQASLDNAKDPKLGLLGWDSTNGGIVNALAMFGYSSDQITAFLSDPLITGIYEQYKISREFMSGTSFLKGVSKIASEVPQTAEVQDLRYLLDAADKLLNLNFVVGLNKETPNAIFDSLRIQNSFKKITDKMSIFDYVRMNEEDRENLAKEWDLKTQNLAADPNNQNVQFQINPFEILNDNYHVFSYIKSLEKLESVMRSSNVYRIIQSASDYMSFFNEDQYNTFEDLVYGLGVDAYIASRGQGRQATLNGKIYDLTLVNTKLGGADSKLGRLEFMRDFPSYFFELKEKMGVPETIRAMLIPGIQGENAIVKFNGSFKDYAVDRKVKAKMMFETINKDFEVPTGDSNLSSVFFYYSLIKDKGGLGTNALTELFDYGNSEFSQFDEFMNDTFATPYINAPDNLKELYANYSIQYVKGQNDGLSAFMRKNRSFIPFTNDFTLNDVIVKDSSTTTSSPTNVEPGGFDVLIDLMRGKKSKNYVDTEVKKALVYPVNRTMLTRLAEQLSDRYGFEAEVLSGDELASVLGESYRGVKGAAYNGKVYINSDIATIDTPIHEFAHLWIQALKRANRPLYNQIQTESLNHPYSEKIREIYPELGDEDIAGEVFSTLLGLHNAGRSYSTANMDFFERTAQMFKDFMNWLNNLFLDIFGMKPSVNDSLLSIIDKVGESMLSTTTFNLSPYDKQVLKVLGVRTETAEDSLDAVRNRLKYQNRFEKICA